MTRRTVWILGDQLLADHPALAAADDASRVLLIESAEHLRRRPYQRKKLVLLLSAMRHYVRELEARGLAVDYVRADSFRAGLRQHLTDHPADEVVTMAAASYAGRRAQQQLASHLNVAVTIRPNTQFLIGRYNPIPDPEPDRRYVMENFYRAMRRHFDVLMEGEDPVGGQWNYDAENRQPLPADDSPPPLPAYPVDDITRAVMDEVAALRTGVGRVDGFDYAVTRAEAEAAADDFFARRLAKFGDYEDALTHRSHAVYHSVLSPYLNLGLLTPLALVRAAVDAYEAGRAPLNAVEGFVRQIIGWREFMYWQYWRQMPGMLDRNAWGAERPLPDFVWHGDTDMACLRFAVRRALDTGYTHHIERLMVLSNFFMLTGVNPRAVNDWFMALYVDAYAWVMPPNVIGMSLNADGGLTATKPYIAGANYINKMGDFCTDCRFNPRKRLGDDACPFNYLYWNFVLEHEARLKANPRTARNTWGLRHFDADERAAIRAAAAGFLDTLAPDHDDA